MPDPDRCIIPGDHVLIDQADIIQTTECSAMWRELVSFLTAPAGSSRQRHPRELKIKAVSGRVRLTFAVISCTAVRRYRYRRAGVATSAFHMDHPPKAGYLFAGRQINTLKRMYWGNYIQGADPTLDSACGKVFFSLARKFLI